MRWGTCVLPSLDELWDPTFDALRDTDGQRCIACGNVVLFYSPADPSRRFLQRSVAALTRLAGKHPGGLGMLVLVPEQAPPPGEDTRRALLESYRELTRVVRGVVLVFEGSGFVASVKRSAAALLGMNLAVPVKVAADMPEATPKLLKLLGPVLDARVTDQHLLEASTRLRAPASR